MRRDHSRGVCYQLGFVILCEQVNVEKKEFLGFRNAARLQMAIKQSFLPRCIGTSPFLLMGDKTVHEDSNNVTRFKYKYKLS